MTDRIRTTISLDPEVHAIFVRMADAAGTSVSRCMGDWLADTADGAQFVALKMQEARQAPKTVMREMQAAVRGLQDEVDATLTQIRKGPPGHQPGSAQQQARNGLAGRQAVQPAARQAARQGLPPSSNTGGKVPQENPNSRGRKGA